MIRAEVVPELTRAWWSVLSSCGLLTGGPDVPTMRPINWRCKKGRAGGARPEA